MEDTGEQKGQINICSACGQTEASVKLEPNRPGMWWVKV